MERDLDIKKLIKMYILNIWVMILAGIIVAGLTSFVPGGTNQSILTKKVFVVLDLEASENEEVEIRKATYFDAYKGLLEGNVLKDSETFNDEERIRLSNLTSTVQYSCYTITMTVPDDEQIEKDQEIFDKYIVESEKWMQEKFSDDEVRIETFYNDVATSKNGSNSAMLTAVGFIVGAILAAMCLFVWFVMDKKIRTEEDVVYYTGVECIGTVRRRK